MHNLVAKGSQKWLQLAVDEKPDLLLSALRRAGAVPYDSQVEWRSPLEADGFKEHRDLEALRQAGIDSLDQKLQVFCPAEGPSGTR